MIKSAAEAVLRSATPLGVITEPAFGSVEEALAAAERSFVIVLVAASAEGASGRVVIGLNFSWASALKEPHALSGRDLQAVVSQLCPGFWPFC